MPQKRVFLLQQKKTKNKKKSLNRGSHFFMKNVLTMGLIFKIFRGSQISLYAQNYPGPTPTPALRPTLTPTPAPTPNPNPSPNPSAQPYPYAQPFPLRPTLPLLPYPYSLTCGQGATGLPCNCQSHSMSAMAGGRNYTWSYGKTLLLSKLLSSEFCVISISAKYIRSMVLSRKTRSRLFPV